MGFFQTLRTWAADLRRGPRQSDNDPGRPSDGLTRAVPGDTGLDEGREVAARDVPPTLIPTTFGTPDQMGPAASAERPRIPRRLGRYEVLSLLGAGGMGRVFKAYDPTLRRHVALKIIREDDPELRMRFLQEASAQARVEHDHVCRVFEAGTLDESDLGGACSYIAMQYIDGKTLATAAREMSLDQKAQVMWQVAEGVYAAHKIGLIHRDLKPANIMVERTGEGEWKPYVMDFGLDKEAAATGLTLTGMVIGTPGYMAPEQARGEIRKLDRRTDVYALGATFYELLERRPTRVERAPATPP